MNIVKCYDCQGFYEEDDTEIVEGKRRCFRCIKTCKHCGESFSYGSEKYCYDCLESGKVT